MNGETIVLKPKDTEETVEIPTDIFCQLSGFIKDLGTVLNKSEKCDACLLYKADKSKAIGWLYKHGGLKNLCETCKTYLEGKSEPFKVTFRHSGLEII